MLRPRFRYSNGLVEKLLQVESARTAIALSAASPLPSNGSAHSAALERVGLKGNESPTENTLFELRAALDNDRTGYRRSGGLLYDATHSELIYVPPDATEIPELMSGLTDWLASSWAAVPAVVLAGVLEEEIVLIQPFERNNSQLARLAGDTVLLRQGYSFASSLQAQLAKQAASYARASHSTHAGVYSELADLSPWLDFYASEVAAVAEQARAALALPAVRPAGAVRPAAAVTDAPAVLRDRLVQVLKHIRANGAIRSGEYQKLAGIVPDTARRDFDDLMAKGLIEVRGVGRATHYVLTQRGAEEAERRRSS